MVNSGPLESSTSPLLPFFGSVVEFSFSFSHSFLLFPLIIFCSSLEAFLLPFFQLFDFILTFAASRFRSPDLSSLFCRLYLFEFFLFLSCILSYPVPPLYVFASLFPSPSSPAVFYPPLLSALLPFSFLYSSFSCFTAFSSLLPFFLSRCSLLRSHCSVALLFF